MIEHGFCSGREDFPSQSPLLAGGACRSAAKEPPTCRQMVLAAATAAQVPGEENRQTPPSLKITLFE